MEVVNDEVIYVKGEKDGNMAEVALQWYTGYDEKTESFANNIATTEGGMHVTGFKTALKKVFVDYGKKFKILKDNEEKNSEIIKFYKKKYTAKADSPTIHNNKSTQCSAINASIFYPYVCRYIISDTMPTEKSKYISNYD